MLSVPGRKPSRFCPRTVVQDGNEFYVLASTLLFGVHDNHQEVRRRLWNAFSLSVLGERLDDIAEGHVNPAGGIRRNEWFAAWMECCALGLALDESDTVSIRRALVGSVRRYSCVGKLAPLQLACGLLAIVYGIGVVLYDTAHEGGSSLGEWHPIRTWEPPENTVPPIRYMNLMQRTGALQMLFEIPIDDDTNDTMGPRNMRNCIPTRMITSLPLSFKTDATFEPVASDIVERHAVYKLHVYDSATRTCGTIGPFVAPATGLRTGVTSLHYMRIDTSMNKPSHIYTIDGCVEQAVSLHIFACQMVAGETKAFCIAHWPVNFCSPRILIEAQDHTILLVPGAPTAKAAAERVIHQWGCETFTGRSQK